MAEATFTLRAVDATKQAFASAQNSLQGLVQSTKLLSRVVLTGFGFGSVFGIVNALVSKITDRMAEVKKIEEQIQEILKRQLQTQKDLFFEKQKPTDQLDLLKKEKSALQANIDLYADTAKWRQVLVQPEPGFAFDEKKSRTPFMITAALRPEQKLRVAQLGDELKKVEAKINAITQALEKQASESLFEGIQQEVNILNETEKVLENNFAKEQERARESIELFDKTRAARLAQKNEQLISDKELGKSMRESVMTPLEKYVAEIENLDRLFKMRIINEQTLIRLTGEAGAAFSAASGDVEDMASRLSLANEEANKTIPAMSQLAQMSNDAGSMIAQGFEDAILSGQKLSEVVRSLGRDLVRLVFQQMVTQRLAAGVTGVLQGKGFAGFMADGGPVSAGSSYVVGEQGPELFVPHASGTIVPNNKMGGGSGSGSGSVTVNYNIAAGVSRAELAPILEQERRRLKAEIPDMVRRGGGYRAAFA
jgi:hypothetical protein